MNNSEQQTTVQQELNLAKQELEHRQLMYSNRNESLRQQIKNSCMMDLNLSREQAEKVSERLVSIQHRDFGSADFALNERQKTSLQATHKKLTGRECALESSNELITSIRDAYMSQVKPHASNPSDRHLVKSMATVELLRNKELFPELAHLQHQNPVTSIGKTFKEAFQGQPLTKNAKDNFEQAFFDHKDAPTGNVVNLMMEANKASEQLKKSEEDLERCEMREASQDTELMDKFLLEKEQQQERAPEKETHSRA